MSEAQPIPIKQAAREVHRDVSVVRELIDRGHLRAFRHGGAPDHPRLRVYLGELRAAIEKHSEYLPKALPQRRANRRAATPTELHPAARALLRD